MPLRTDAPDFRDADLALRLYDLRREAEMRKARDMIGDLLDGASWEAVERVRSYAHPENAHFRQVVSYWEIAASFVVRGVLHPDVYLDTCGEGLYLYSVMKPHLARIREESPRFLAHTEALLQAHEGARAKVEQLDAMRAAWQAKAAAAKPVRKARAAKARRPLAKKR